MYIRKKTYTIKHVIQNFVMDTVKTDSRTAYPTQKINQYILPSAGNTNRSECT